MKSKLYYYELVLKVQSNHLADVLEFTSRHGVLILGFKDVSSNSKKTKSQAETKLKISVFELQCVFLKDLTSEDLVMLSSCVSLNSSRTRSITGDDVSIYHAYHVIDAVTRNLLSSFTEVK